jgi:putative ABC transport system ATP-binding protein
MRGAKHPLQVLKGVSLSLKAGEMLTIVGPSGSGKSTLLRCLAGLEPVTEGHITLLNTNLSRATRATIAHLLQDPVGLLFPTPPLVPSLTALQNVELPGRLGARSSWSNHELALKHMDNLGVRDVANDTPEKLTPPQAARVALARVLTQTPKIVFADEPTGRLSIEDSQLVVDALHLLCAEGCAVVLATHDLHLAAQADRVICLVDGEIQSVMEHPSAQEILERLGDVALPAPVA